MASPNPHISLQSYSSLSHRARTDYASPAEVAAHLRCSRSKLEAMRASGDGPPFIKPTPRQVLYAVGDVLDWLAAHPKLQSTSDPAAAVRVRATAATLEGWMFSHETSPTSSSR